MNRSAIPCHIKRKIYYESMGHCMNPSCNYDFFENNCSEKAHIKSVADDGNNSFDNLIHLCANCHTKFDKNESDWDNNTLKDWKKSRQEIIKQQFAPLVADFESLKNLVVPILAHNQTIFKNYGPHEETTHPLWGKFESQIITNNRKLELLLSKNITLIHINNQEIIQEFIQHSQEFLETRNDSTIARKILFPEDILSMFGLKKVDGRVLTNVSPLQNFISFLQKENRYISLNLIDIPPILRYINEEKKEIELELTDEPNLRQILFNGHFFRQHNNSLRFEDLIFFLKWLSNKDIQFEFSEFPNLSKLILNKKYVVQLFYEYIVSISFLHNMESRNLICVNLYNWNGGQYSADAMQYANNFNMKLLNQNDFFIFAHKNIK